MNETDQQKSIAPPPSLLRSTQEWFASIITSPLGDKDTIQERSPRGRLIAEEASLYITPGPTLPPHLRIQIYNQQYWWRLLNILQENFPLAARILGRPAFNQKIAIPFLLKHPPSHWSLNTLGTFLPQWISDHYQEPDRSLLANASQLDWAFMANMISQEQPPLNLTEIIEDTPEKLLSTTFYLQPYITLFNWNYDLFSFRENLLDHEPEYWINHPIPELTKERPYSFILFRLPNSNLAWREISKGEYTLLKKFQTGSTMGDACESIEAENDSLQEEIAENLQQWLQQWTQSGWLTLNKNEINK